MRFTQGQFTNNVEIAQKKTERINTLSQKAVPV